MDVKNFNEFSGWFSSYLPSEQGRALINAQKKKIDQLNEILSEVGNLVKGNELINNIPEVECSVGYFKWVG